MTANGVDTSRRTLRWAVAMLVGCGTMGVAGQLRVTGDRVNLRSDADLESEVVAQVMDGDFLSGLGPADAEWVKVVPPASVSLWVYKELVGHDGVVSVSDLRVRCGPGINYRAVGRVDKGTRVVVRGTRGDWLEIAPPPGSVLWVSGEYVEAADGTDASRQPAVRQPTTRTPPKPTSVKVGGDVERVRKPPKPLEVGASAMPSVVRPPRPVSEGPLPAPSEAELSEGRHYASYLGGKRLLSTPDQGETVSYQGLVGRSVLAWGKPSKYRLSKRDEKGRYYTVCYLLGKKETLSAVVGEKVSVEGLRYWLQGVKEPALVVDKVRLQE